jgi:hypothetical protein
MNVDIDAPKKSCYVLMTCENSKKKTFKLPKKGPNFFETPQNWETQNLLNSPIIGEIFLGDAGNFRSMPKM